MGFKDHVANDIKNIFANIREHADLTWVRYNTEQGSYIPVIFDNDGNVERVRSNAPHVGRDSVDDVFISDLVVYIAEKDLNMKPRRETRIEIADEIYNIVRVSDESGMFKLWLQMFDD